MAAVIKIEVITSGGLDQVKKDVADLGRTAEQSGGGFNALQEIAGGALRAIGEGLVGLAVKGFGMLSDAVKDGIADARQNAQIQAQTAQVIKSTGEAAGVSAQHVMEYASSLSDAAGTSLFGDDQIQQSTNLLLTFTEIKGATLDAATAISVDMAQALGGAPKDAAIQLGKALNDPIKGITALTRVGVTFSDEQKAQIQAMQEAGDTAGAQAIILAELNKEFGGSAAAAAAATGGWSEFNGRMGEAKEALGAAVLPLLNSLAGVLNDTVLPMVENFASVFGGLVSDLSTGGIGVFADDIREMTGIDIMPLVNGIQSLVETVMTAFSDGGLQGIIQLFINKLAEISPGFALLKGIIEAALPPIQAIVMSVFGIISGFIQEHGAKIKADLTGAWQQIQALIQAILPPIQTIVSAVFGAIATFLAAHGTEIKAFMAQTWDTIATIVRTVLAILQAIIPPVLAAIAGFISAHGTEIQAILSAAWTVISTIITTVLNTIRGVVTAVMQAINGDWSGAWETIKQTCAGIVQAIITIVTTDLNLLVTLFGGMVNDVISALEGLASQAVSLGANIIDGIIQGVRSGVAALEGAVRSAANNALDAAKNALGISSPSAIFADEVGTPIIVGIMQGIQSALPALFGAIDDLKGDMLSKFDSIAKEAGDIISDAFMGTASLDRSKARAMAALKDLGAQQQKVAEGQLKIASEEAAAIKDPEQAAKWFKMRSDQILELAKLQDAINKALTAEQRAAIEAQITASTAQMNALKGQIPELQDQLKGDLTAIERAQLNLDMAKLQDKASKDLTAIEREQLNIDMAKLQDKASKDLTDEQRAAKETQLATLTAQMDALKGQIPALQDQLKGVDAATRDRMIQQMSLIEQAQIAEKSALDAQQGGKSPLQDLINKISELWSKLPPGTDNPDLAKLFALLPQLQALATPNVPIAGVGANAGGGGGSTSNSSMFNYAPTINSSGNVSAPMDLALARSLAGV